MPADRPDRSPRRSRQPWEDYRLAEIPVDDAWVRKYNENRAEVRRLQWSAAILGLVVLAAALALMIVQHFQSWTWFIGGALGLFALGCAAMIVYIPRKMGSFSHTYATSELVPAIVAEVRPRGFTLLALVDRAVDRSQGRRPALVTRGCEKLPGHTIREGERVPCVAVVGNRSTRSRDNTYAFLSPMPVAWATPDASVVRRCAESIPDREWELLRRERGRVREVEDIPTHVLPLD